MKCREALDLLGDLVDQDLQQGQRLRLRLHLLICRHCRHYLAAYRKTIQAGKTAYQELDGQDEQIPDGQVAAILNALRVK